MRASNILAETSTDKIHAHRMKLGLAFASMANSLGPHAQASPRARRFGYANDVQAAPQSRRNRYALIETVPTLVKK